MVAFEDPSQHPLLVLSDLTAAGTVVAAFVGWLPPIAGLLSVVWFCIQIYESRSFQGWLSRSKDRRISRLEDRLHSMRASRVSQAPSSDKS